MKTQLIKLKDYNIIVSDKEIKGKGLRVDLERMSVGFIDSDTLYNQQPEQFKKVIASDNPEHNLPNIDYNGLEEEFGIVDVEKIACKKYYVMDGLDDYDENYYNGTNVDKAKAFIDGFKKAQELNDKKFSLQDIIKSIEFIDEDMTSEQILQVLQKTKVFDVDIQIDNNKIKINKAL